MTKGIPFDDLKQFDDRVKLCVAFGETREKFTDVFTNCICRLTMKEALEEACAHARPGDGSCCHRPVPVLISFIIMRSVGASSKQMVRELL